MEKNEYCIKSSRGFETKSIASRYSKGKFNEKLIVKFNRIIYLAIYLNSEQAKQYMKHIITIILAFLLFLPGIAQEELIILHTNDLHSRLNGFSPEAAYTPTSIHDDSTRGGFARLASMIREEKMANPNRVLALDAGDFLMGTLFHALELETGFQLPLMKKMGYDAVSIGNHEFDFGPGDLARIIQVSAEKDSIPDLLLSNMKFQKKDTADDALKALYDQRIIKPYQIVTIGNKKIGIFSLLGVEAASVAPQSHPVEFVKPVKAAKKMARELKKDQQADVVICLSHSGVRQNENGEWEGEDIKLAKKVKDIDVIISGHSHTFLKEPVYVDGTPVLQTGSYGANMGKLSLLVTADSVKVTSYEMLVVDDKVKGAEDIQSAIEIQQERISREILQPLGIS